MEQIIFYWVIKP